jgi:hypothetical protein
MPLFISKFQHQMNLKNFEISISQTILERGKSYYKSNTIKHLQETHNGQWFAVVEGTDDYEVEISIDSSGEITGYDCDCPFDGEICKHVVAVLLKIRGSQKGGKTVRKSAKEAPWQSIINNLPEPDLRSFITQYASRNSDFRNKLTMNYPAFDKTGDKDKYKKIVKAIFKSGARMHGFIDYYNTGRVMSKIFELLHAAENALKIGEHKETFLIVTAIAPECISAIQSMDDSDGECGDAISLAFELTAKLLNDTSDNVFRDEVFEWILDQAKNNDYDDYGCADALYPLLTEAVDSDIKAAKVDAFLDSQLKHNKEREGWSGEYNNRRILGLKYDLYIKTNQSAKAEKIIQDNIHIHDFREIIVKRELVSKKYDKAIKLIKEGITIAEKEGYPGTENNWKEMLLEVYKETGNQKETRNTALELYFSAHDSIKFYRIYKNTFANEEWPAALKKITDQLSRKQDKTRSLCPVVNPELAQVYIEEKMWPELYEMISKNPRIHELTNYSKYLVDDYASEILVLYKKAIETEAQRASDRKEYKRITDYIIEMANMGHGKKQAKSLTESLIDQYKKRPAMIEELSKVLKHPALK